MKGFGRQLAWIFMVFLWVCTTGCEPTQGSTDSTEAAQAPTFAEISGLLVKRGCAEGTCHGGVSPQAGLNLEPEFAYEALVNQPCSMPGAAELGLNLVTPGDPDNSFLYVKVMLSDDDPHLGSPMPTYGSGLSLEDTEKIRLWIEAGAPRNP